MSPPAGGAASTVVTESDAGNVQGSGAEASSCDVVQAVMGISTRAHAAIVSFFAPNSETPIARRYLTV
jgi:hypothetical protein